MGERTVSLYSHIMTPLTPWNKGRKVGPRVHLKVPEATAIHKFLLAVTRLRDLAMFLAAIDSMLRCSDLLALKVADVQSPSGEIYDRLEVGQKKTDEMVYPTFSPQARRALAAWIKHSGKRRSDWLFTALKDPHGSALSHSQYRDLVKFWVEAIGLDPSKYSTHSLRRTKPVWMWKFGNPNRVTITVLKELLGHKSVDSTTRYLGLDAMEAQDVALEHNIFASGADRKQRSTRTLSQGDLQAIAKVTTDRFEREVFTPTDQRQHQSLQPLNDADIQAIAAATAKLLKG